jgi:hypothetical protein
MHGSITREIDEKKNPNEQPAMGRTNMCLTP